MGSDGFSLQQPIVLFGGTLGCEGLTSVEKSLRFLCRYIFIKQILEKLILRRGK